MSKFIYQTIPKLTKFGINYTHLRPLNRHLHPYSTAMEAPPTLKALQTYSYSQVLGKHFPNVPKVPLYIDGKEVQSSSDLFMPVHNPATQEVVSFVPQATPEECAAALSSSQAAFQKWRKVSILTRQKVMFELQRLLREEMDQIAAIISHELGKTKVDAKGDVLRGLRKCSSMRRASIFINFDYFSFFYSF